jgi:hypothetical protein
MVVSQLKSFRTPATGSYRARWIQDLQEVVAYFNALSRQLPVETEENHETISARLPGLQAEIWTWDIPNMVQDC